MSRRTYTWNAFETSLVSSLTSGSLIAVVESVVGLTAPLYLVVDPDIPGKREWIKVGSINGNSLEALTRNLAGSVGDITHDPGAKVRAIFSKQLQDDLFTDIEDLAIADADHVLNASDPHAAAGYLKLATADARYLRLIGGTLTGPLTLPSSAPSNANHATRKGYVDQGDADTLAAADASAIADIATHAGIIGAHHTRYTDGEAVNAMGGLGNGNPLNHTRYSNTDAVAAMGAVGNSNPLNHVRYSDANALAAVDAVAQLPRITRRWQGSVSVDAGLSVAVKYNISSLGLSNTNNCIVIITHGATNQQTQKSIVTYQNFSVSEIDIVAHGTSGITAPGNCFFSVAIIDFGEAVVQSAPPIIP